MFDYYADRFGKECLELAMNCKSDIAFGAVLVYKNKIIGRGWNRLSTKLDRYRLRYIDYATHAEQAAILDALRNNHPICNSQIYVLGMSKHKNTFGKLDVREGETFFGCKKCPHAFIEFNISVNVPYVEGWRKLTPKQAMITGKEFNKTKSWKNFVLTGELCK